MKARLTVTINKQLIMKVKRYAASRKVSVSQIVEDHFVKLTMKTPKKNLIDLIESLPKPRVPKGDLIKAYYEQNRKKYGF